MMPLAAPKNRVANRARLRSFNLHERAFYAGAPSFASPWLLRSSGAPNCDPPGRHRPGVCHRAVAGDGTAGPDRFRDRERVGRGLAAGSAVSRVEFLSQTHDRAAGDLFMVVWPGGYI